MVEPGAMLLFGNDVVREEPGTNVILIPPGACHREVGFLQQTQPHASVDDGINVSFVQLGSGVGSRESGVGSRENL